jgi:hypothetical protein
MIRSIISFVIAILQYLKSKIDPRHLIVFIDACHAAAATVDGTARDGSDAGASLSATWKFTLLGWAIVPWFISLAMFVNKNTEARTLLMK